MIPADRIVSELSRLFGEDATLLTQTYVQTLSALQQMALAASRENDGHTLRCVPALTQVYASEAAVYREVARELRRATARIKDILDGVTVAAIREGETSCNS